MGESIKKGEFMTKIFIWIMLNEVLKTCKNSYLLMYIKEAKVKQLEIEGLVASYNFS